MRHFLITGTICGCLLIGSFYPRLILDHHLRLVDETGKEITMEGDYAEEIPVEFRFWFTRFFR